MLRLVYMLLLFFFLLSETCVVTCAWNEVYKIHNRKRTWFWKAKAEFGLSAITIHFTQEYVISKWAFQSRTGLEHILEKKNLLFESQIAFNKANDENCKNETTKKTDKKTSKVNNEG